MFKYVSIIHAIVWLLVPTSGAGMSYSGPMFSPSACVKRRVMRWSSSRETWVRVELDAALAAAERDAHERALPRHHRGERLHVVERDGLVVAHAALEGPEQVVVLDAIALEEANLDRCPSSPGS